MKNNIVTNNTYTPTEVVTTTATPNETYTSVYYSCIESPPQVAPKEDYSGYYFLFIAIALLIAWLIGHIFYKVGLAEARKEAADLNLGYYDFNNSGRRSFYWNEHSKEGEDQ